MIEAPHESWGKQPLNKVKMNSTLYQEVSRIIIITITHMI